MYVDESGDTGLQNSPTDFFVLSGIVVHESRWREFLNRLIALRRTLRAAHRLPIRAEIHASHFINHKPVDLPRHARLAVLRNTIDELAKLDYISITNVVVRKVGKLPDYDVFDNAWRILFQRFENTLGGGNFPGGFSKDYGMVITDATAGRNLMRLVRRMAVHNFVPHDPSRGMGARNVPMTRIIEDPQGRDSAETLPIQMADVVAYFLHQKYKPSAYIWKTRSQRYFERLGPVLNKKASRFNKMGIVVL